jgi:hypothetical protein
MWVKPAEGSRDERRAECNRLEAEIRLWLETSRFTARLTVEFRQGRWGVKVENVRKRVRSHYCGQHPNECQAGGGRQKRTGFWLEGSDWVGFNDGLNDLLDRLGVSADVWSSNRESMPGGRYYVRRKRCRRTNYESECAGGWGRVFFLWSHQNPDFEDCCGKEAPRSHYPDGTPGVPDWRPEAEAEHAET